MKMRIAEDKYIPTELCTEVLARLPSKSLLRFRCVCKAWRSIIETPGFMNMHIDLCKNNSEKKYLVCLTCSYDCRRIGYNLMFNISRRDISKEYANNLEFFAVPHSMTKVHGYLHGVVLLEQGDRYDNRKGLILWNPSIRKSVILPQYPHDDYLTSFTLGFDPSCNDYKVLASSFIYSVAIYSLSSHTWKTKRTDFPFFYIMDYPKVFVKGAVHWIGFTHKFQTLGHCSDIFSFDFSVEDFTCIHLPYDRHTKHLQLDRIPFVLGKSLAIIEISHLHSCVWVLAKTDGKVSWSKWYTGDSNTMSYKFFNDNRAFIQDSIFLEKSKTFLVNVGNGVKSYDLRNNQIQELERYRSNNVKYIGTYVESLVLSEQGSGSVEFQQCPDQNH